jgi:uncharacterized protein (TIGR03086 family)
MGGPDPCTSWNARDVVNHVVAGHELYLHLLAGEEARSLLGMLAQDWVGADPAGACRLSAARIRNAFNEPGALDRDVNHPLGQTTGRGLLGWRLTELVVHDWDLARAVGTDDRIEHDLVLACAEHLAPYTDNLVTTGVFAATVPSSPEANAQARLRHSLGRHP